MLRLFTNCRSGWENLTLSKDAGGPPVPGRTCGTCTLCCKLLSVEALDKPVGKWCQHCVIGRGCLVYNTRPQECRDFYCGFMTLHHLGEEWRPSASKLILGIEPDGNSIYVVVDPTRPNAWQSDPFYSKLKEWARNAVPLHGHVIVRLGSRRIVILPDRDVDLGIVSDDEMIVIGEQRLPTGLVLAPMKIKRDDPRAGRIQRGGPPIPLT
jgi:hypothetical protein